jgi:1-acyl-sn-glycerol-3-phosphate acyltransferase
MRWFWWLSQGLSRVFANMFWKFRVFGLENLPREGGVLLASNHQSVLDPVLVAMVLPREMHFMARRTLFRNPVFRAIIVSYNAFAIERDTADVKGVKTAIARLEAGNILLVFPEGTRTENGEIGRMKPGIGMLAERAAVPIVPVLIQGAYEALGKGRLFPRLGRISLVFGKPLPPSDDKTAVARIHDAVVGLKGDIPRCRIASSSGT